MSTIALEAYSVSVREKRSQTPLRLGAFDERARLFDVIFSILTEAQREHENVSLYKKCIRIEDLTAEDQTIDGRMWSGPYGTTNPLVDVPTGKTSYEQKTTDARMEPYFFSLYLPDAFKKGILLAQRTGQTGIKTQLAMLLGREFSKKFPGFKLDLFPLMPEQALQTLVEKSVLAEVRFIKNIISSDYADKFNGNKQAQDGEIEFIIRPKRKGYLDPRSLLDLFSGKKVASDFLEMDDFEPDNIKAEIVSNGRHRIIDFGNTSDFEPLLISTRA